MATLVTTSGKTVLLDSEDYDILVNNFDPIRLSVTTNGYVVLKVGRKQSHLVRLILGIVASSDTQLQSNADQPSLIVKYRNNNKLDLRRENLRVSTRKEHCREEVLPHAPEVKKVQGVHKLDSKTWIVEDGHDTRGRLVYKKFSSFEAAKNYVDIK